MTGLGRPVLVFRVGEWRFGLEAAAVESVVQMVEITPLPEGPAAVDGVIDAGGEIVPVASIRRRFGLPHRACDPADYLVFANMAKRRVALAAEEIIEVREVGEDWVDKEEIGLGAEPIAGVVRASDGLIVIQDLDAFLSPAEEEQLNKALSSHH